MKHWNELLIAVLNYTVIGSDRSSVRQQVLKDLDKPGVVSGRVFDTGRSPIREKAANSTVKNKSHQKGLQTRIQPFRYAVGMPWPYTELCNTFFFFMKAGTSLSLK